MIGIELRCTFSQRAAAFPVPGIGEVQPKKSGGVSLHAVESQGALGRGAKLAQLPAEEVGGCQCRMRQLTGRREIHGPSRRRQRAIHRIGPCVISMRIFGAIEPREHRPAIGVIWSFLHGVFQRRNSRQVFVLAHVLMKSEAAQQSLVGRERFRIAIPQRFGHAVGQNALCVSDRGDDARHDIVQHIERVFRRERAVVGFRPKTGAGVGVDKLHSDANFSSRLPDAAFHHIARAEFLADGADVAGFAGVFSSRAARDHARDRRSATVR